MGTGRKLCATVLVILLVLSDTSVSAADGISVDTTLFTDTQVRLNRELYDMTASVFNRAHMTKDYGRPGTALAESYLAAADPLIPLALAVNETGMWMDTRYTWSSGVYSALLADAGVSMGRLQAAQVNVDTYVVSNLCTCYGCGPNCTADKNSHYHTIGNNDNDSLGPLQILRRYVEKEGAITYDCGERVADLMAWEDNVVYLTHNQSRLFMSESNWNKDHTISSAYELAALMGTAHNTGTAFLSNPEDAGSLWKSPGAVYAYCRAIATEDSLRVVDRHLDRWWEDVRTAQENGTSFILLGQYGKGALDGILAEMGINKTDYAGSFGHKQYYPLKAMLNYACLARLYHSGT